MEPDKQKLKSNIVISSKTNLPQKDSKTVVASKSNENKTNNSDNLSNRSKDEKNYTYSATQVIGSGSFGIVYQAIIHETGEVVAIKKVLQDKRYKNRELEIIKDLNHHNVVKLKNAFFTSGDKPEEMYLNAVMEYIPETLSRIIRQYAKSKNQMPTILVKVYAYQMMRALAYIHAVGVCHRDIKPQNILVDPNTQVLKLCDFGSAKRLVKGEPNVAYICSRYYRAPELIFGATDYTNQIDVWSIGCVIAELVLGRPIFPGESAVDQLVEIIKILGTPSKSQVLVMNPDYKEYKFPSIKPYPWTKLFKNCKNVNDDFMDLISKLLVYEPNIRLTPLKALLHPFFDELRDDSTLLPNKQPLPKELFIFSLEEFNSDQETVEKLIPIKKN